MSAFRVKEREEARFWEREDNYLGFEQVGKIQMGLQTLGLLVHQQGDLRTSHFPFPKW